MVVFAPRTVRRSMRGAPRARLVRALLLLGAWLLLCSWFLRRDVFEPAAPALHSRESSQATPSLAMHAAAAIPPGTPSTVPTDPTAPAALAALRTAPSTIASHLSGDFARGEKENVVLDAPRMQLGAALVSSLDPGVFLGSYVSPPATPGQPRQPFRSIAASWDIDTRGGGQFQLELRTRSEATGAWSLWRQIPPTDVNRPQALPELSNDWQYRLTLYALDVAKSPIVYNVTIATHPAAIEPEPSTPDEP